MVEIEDSSSNDVGGYGHHDLGAGVGMHMGRMPMPRTYDALGRRIRMIDKAAEPDVTTLYYYNPDWQVLAEYDNAGDQQRGIGRNQALASFGRDSSSVSLPVIIDVPGSRPLLTRCEGCASSCDNRGIATRPLSHGSRRKVSDWFGI